MFFKSITSPNFGERKGGVKPSLIIIHYTGMETGKAALDRLCDPSSGVSAHYFIDERGKVLNLVPDDKRAWHAGASYWRGESDINSHSIGIELVNKGHEFGYEDFPPAQIRALVKLCQKLMKKYAISPSGVLGHSDVAPGRKFDPGEKFPWPELARKNVGLWPEPEEGDFKGGEDFDRLLLDFGYNPEVGPAERLYAYYQHFAPHKIDDGGALGKPCAHCAARLRALVRLGATHKT